MHKSRGQITGNIIKYALDNNCMAMLEIMSMQFKNLAKHLDFDFKSFRGRYELDISGKTNTSDSSVMHFTIDLDKPILSEALRITFELSDFVYESLAILLATLLDTENVTVYTALQRIDKVCLVKKYRELSDIVKLADYPLSTTSKIESLLKCNGFLYGTEVAQDYVVKKEVYILRSDYDSVIALLENQIKVLVYDFARCLLGSTTSVNIDVHFKNLGVLK